MQQQSSLRVVFAGTPTFAAAHLQALIDSPHQIVAVLTQPDRPAGRGKKLTPSAVKVLAEQYQLPVFQPPSLKSAEQQDIISRMTADIMVVVAYGLLLPQAVLDLPKYGCINVHGSLLPRWRGAAPVQRAIEAGDAETGITIMQMDAGLDTGPMLKKIGFEIQSSDTTVDLFDRLTPIGTDALLTVVNQIPNLEPVEQDSALATYADKISKAEAAIDWRQSAQIIDQKIRAFNPFPIAFTESQNERVKIYRASIVERPHSKTPGTIVEIENNGIIVACGEGCLCLQEIQLPNKKPMTPKAILLGNKSRFAVGDCFSAPESSPTVSPT